MTPYSSISKEDLLPYVGDIRQLAGITLGMLADGKGRGLRTADFDNGSGLVFQVLLDRGMDIGRATFKGIPLAYRSPVGPVHPAYYEADGFRWLRSFGGGLLTGCGLTNVGTPQQEEGMQPDGPLGLHGRLSNTPAEQVSVQEEWVDGAYQLAISGTLRQASVFGENLEVRRTIRTAMGRNTITVSDQVANRGFRPSPLMQLYHINLGFPLLSEHATLEARVYSSRPRTESARAALADWNRFDPPTANAQEFCFYHNIDEDPDGLARITLVNPECGLRLCVGYRTHELPFFTQWKMMGEQEYVLGLEPANCHPDGQARERETKTLRFLDPGQETEHLVTISVSDGESRGA